ncbi:hypothetical protein A5651_15560 [Mycobacterium sp. 1274761.0]|nr:hypothetical protein A5651_15560 [Mycobacterium sp. 1274761.0]
MLGTPGFVGGPVSGLRSSSWAMQWSSAVYSPPALRQHFLSSRFHCAQLQLFWMALESTSFSQLASWSIFNGLGSADAMAAFPSAPNMVVAANTAAASPARRLVSELELLVLFIVMTEFSWPANDVENPRGARLRCSMEIISYPPGK